MGKSWDSNKDCRPGQRPNAPTDGSNPMADGDTNSNAEDARNAKEAPLWAAQANIGGVQKEYA